jgi:hypothetical protein
MLIAINSDFRIAQCLKDSMFLIIVIVHRFAESEQEYVLLVHLNPPRGQVRREKNRIYCVVGLWVPVLSIQNPTNICYFSN